MKKRKTQKPISNKKINKYHRIQNNYYYKYKKSKEIDEVIEKRYNILIIIIVAIITVLFVFLFYIQIFKQTYYIEKVESLNGNIIEGPTAPRGRIYDRNHRLIVDNKPIKVIYYKKPTGITTKKEIELAYKLVEMLEVDYSKLKEKDLKKFWIINNEKKAKAKITDKEWKKLSERKLTNDQINDLKLERVTESDLESFDDVDKEAAYIYKLMNTGYSYSEKVIKKGDSISDSEYAIISKNIHTLDGFNTKLDWDREYLYGSTFKTILGSVSTSESGIPYELKDYYLNKGYTLDDRVGTSYLEYQYEDYLRGTKDKFEIQKDGSYKLIEEGNRGNDLVLSIDIELQKEIERILEEKLLEAKGEPNTEYYNRSFVIIADPNTGEILAMAGKQIIKEGEEYKFYDYTPGVTTSPVTVGSIIKGASHIVGYNTDSLKIGEIRNDACVKIAATPEKCSWKYLGNLNDIDALKYSSNVYQFLTAINVGHGIYQYNMPLKIDESAFDIYRNTFSQFGLGVKTGIDLPLESLGYKGTSHLSGHLLDFAIGQYDTYTPIQLSQYIGTIANGGKRMKPFLLKEVYNSKSEEPLSDLIYKTEPEVLNNVETDPIYLDRVKQGFKAVMEYGGTGSGYIDSNYNPAGKTGTSQSFIDTDNDGIIDTETITNTFGGFVPYEDPRYTFTVISPDTYHYGNNSEYQTYVNKHISAEVSKKFFEFYQ